MDWFWRLFGRGMPAYLFLAAFYVVYVGIVALPNVWGGSMADDACERANTDVVITAPIGEQVDGVAVEGEGTAAVVTDAQVQPASVAEQVECVLDASLFKVPLVSGTEFPITWTSLFVIFGFLASWIEVIRATAARDISGNDWMSLVVTLVCLVLFFTVSWFGTTAFMVITLVGIGDLLLDRIVGQAVARRDFGGVLPTGH
ncbi:MAG: hypothetical protein MRY63_14500 [Neomegalonema sp.]|nr:hypothetical protein [Neomegalonema sp.]